MTKMIKMSLVAAVAVAGFTTTASAQSLENAIKNVSVKGYLQYRWDKDLEADTSVSNTAGGDANKFRVQATAKANDTVSLTLRATDHTDNFTVDRQYLTANFGSTTVIAGKISDLSPFTDGLGVHGEVALFSVNKGLTLGAAYYHMDQGASDASDAKDVAAVVALGNAGAVNYKLWFVSHKDTNNYTFASVAAKVASANVELAYSLKTDETGANLDDQSQLRLVATTKMDNVSVKAAIVQAGKDGANIMLDGDSDATANFQSSKLSTSSATDATGGYLSVGTKVSPEVGLSAEYFTIDGGKDLTLKATYQVAKNTSTYIRYSTGNAVDTATGADGADFEAVRIQAKYSF